LGLQQNDFVTKVISMSLNFGLYLVEQGVISCDQFCGLVKVQQMALPTPASVAIRSNLLTVRQVGQVLSLMELNPGRTFFEAARSLGLLGNDGQKRLEQAQQMLLPAIPFLLVECGLLNSRQVETLQRAFEKSQVTEKSLETSPTAEPAIERNQPLQPSQGSPAPATQDHSLAGRRVHAAQVIRQPKFIQHPQVQSFEEAYYG
jgi:hypothetical protein